MPSSAGSHGCEQYQFLPSSSAGSGNARARLLYVINKSRMIAGRVYVSRFLRRESSSTPRSTPCVCKRNCVAKLSGGWRRARPRLLPHARDRRGAPLDPPRRRRRASVAPRRCAMRGGGGKVTNPHSRTAAARGLAVGAGLRTRLARDASSTIGLALFPLYRWMPAGRPRL